MKTSLVFLSFISLALISTISGQSNVVRDSDGNPLQAGTDYYILPVNQGKGGGIALDSIRGQRCPLDVVQQHNDMDNGLPMTFTPVDKKSVIYESTDLNIKFSASSICVQSTVWMLEGFENQQIVSTRGVEGNPGRETLTSWFRIDKYENDYKLVYCPGVCDTCRPICGDIGVYYRKNGSRPLALSNSPLKIKFKKA